MYKHIMLPVDGSDLSNKAAKECVTFAKAIGARIFVIHVVSHFHFAIEEGFSSGVVRKLEKEHEAESKKNAQTILGSVQKLADAGGVECSALSIIGDNPYEEIIKHAKKQKCDLIMMASHGRRGLEGLLLGSETAKVLTHSKIPVLVVR